MSENKTTEDGQKHVKIYLADHLAMMVAEVELAERCLRSNRGTPLGEFLEQLHMEIKAQRSIVQDVAKRLSGRESLIKDSGAWLAEKVGRLKLNGSLIGYSGLSRLLELEALAALAVERIALWDNLDGLATRDSRLEGITYSFFRKQSEQHLERLHEQRKRAAGLAL